MFNVGVPVGQVNGVRVGIGTRIRVWSRKCGAYTGM